MAEYRPDHRFLTVPHAVLELGLKAAEVATYCALRYYADYGKDTGARVSDAKAAERAGTGERTFRAARARLRELGLVTWQRTGRSNIYLVHSVPPGKAPRRQAAPAKPKPGRQELPIRTAPGAEQSGTDGRTERPGLPDDSTKSQDQPATTGTAARQRRVRIVPETWMSPYMDLHRELMGGEMNPGKWVRTFKHMLVLATEEEILRHQRHYLQSLLDSGRTDFLNYARFAETFGRWALPAGPSGKPRPTAGTTGKDFLA